MFALYLEFFGVDDVVHLRDPEFRVEAERNGRTNFGAR
jgi:hypothetical protein